MTGMRLAKVEDGAGEATPDEVKAAGAVTFWMVMVNLSAREFWQPLGGVEEGTTMPVTP
jgi:hypothetical protein